MFRKEVNEMAICLAIDGWRGQPDFQAITMCAVKRVGGCPGLNINGQHQVFTVPLVPMRSQCLCIYLDGMKRPCLQQVAVSVMEDAGFPCGRSFTS